MKFIILSGLALAGLVGCSAPKTYTLDDKAKNGVIEAQQRKIGQLMDSMQEMSKRIQLLEDGNDWRGVTIKALLDRCDQGNRPDGSVRYPVSTANTPEDAMAAVNKIYSRDGIEQHEQGNLKVKNVKMDVGKGWPDIVCFEFGAQDGEDLGKTCFDPMEITER